MLMTTCWPELMQLNLEAQLYKSLINHFVEPFGNKAEAQRFWADTPTQLLIIQPDDTESALENVTESFLQQMKFAFNCPELTSELSDGYQLYLSIVSDDGAGLYLVIHQDSPICEALRYG